MRKLKIKNRWMGFSALVQIGILTGLFSAQAVAAQNELRRVDPGAKNTYGFVCTSVDQDTEIQVYYSPADPADDRGPRAQTMVVSDPTMSRSRQLIAKFSATDGLLNNSDGLIVASIDLNHPDSSRRGKRLGGTVLGSLRSIYLEIDFSYQEPVTDGTRLAAQVVYMKTNGSELTQDFDCVRYADSATMRLHLNQDL